MKRLLPVLTLLLVLAAAAALAEDNPKDLRVSGDKLNLDTIGGSITGTIDNLGTSEWDLVQVEFNLYDKDGNQVGNASDLVQNLESRGRWKFKAGFLDEGVVKYKLKAVTGTKKGG